MVDDWTLLAEIWPSLVSRIGMAVVCGFVLGLEREWKDKPAGLRTILLITVGATLYMIVSELIPRIAEGPEATMRVDPSRIAAQVVSGIGFLGAGTIIQARGSVHGLTTAAVIWTAAGIGLCIGIGFPFLGLIVTCAVMLVLVAMRPIRTHLSRLGEESQLQFNAPNDNLRLLQVRQLFHSEGVEDEHIDVQVLSPEEVRVRVAHNASGGALSRILMALTRIDGVHGTELSDVELYAGRAEEE